jgi:hypothetical protein
MLRKRRTYFVGGAILLAFIAGLLVGSYLSEPTEIVVPSEYFDQMTLLTWRGWSGDLCFLLIPMTERGRARHDFWSKWKGQCGLAKLKETLAAVPRDKHVEWNNSPPKFELPSEKFCDQMVEWAKKEGVDLRTNPSLDTWFSDWEPR